MGATLVIANQKQAYVLADRGTYLQFREKIQLVPLATQSKAMQNPYGVMVVNPNKHPQINHQQANLLVDYLISPETQQSIADYQVDGEPLFIPLHSTIP